MTARPIPKRRTDDSAQNWTPKRRRMLLARFAGVPYPNWLGLKVKKLGAGTACLALKIEKKHHQYQGLAHGGVLASLADTVATFAALTILPEGVDLVTIEFKVNFLAAVSGGEIIAESGVVKLGARVSVADVRVFNARDHRLVLTGTFTMLNFPTAKADGAKRKV